MKWSKLPKRKRMAAVTAAAAVVFLAAAATFVTRGLRHGAVYRPGEDLEGVTEDLARGLPPDYPRVRFEDVSQKAGIEFRHFPGVRSTQLPEDMGSGAAWADYDGDGWLDLYVVNEPGPMTLSPAQVAASPGHAALYHNERNGTFKEVSEQAGVAFRGWGQGAAWGDFDGDGRPDLIVTSYDRLVLYHNNGDGTFTDVTKKAGLDGFRGFWAGATPIDYNRDGRLDIYICGYVKYDPSAVHGTSKQYATEVPASLNPSAYPPERNLLLRNNGDGTFTDVARRAGVEDLTGRSLSASPADLDEDGWPDIYVANDVSDNVLYRNRGDGTFEDISHPALVADYRGAMGLAVGDWNGDGDTDIFITHWLAQENGFYDNKLRQSFTSLAAPPVHSLQFMDEADRYGVGQIGLDFVKFGTAFLDYDNDGRPDIIISTGSTVQDEKDPTKLVAQRPLLFWNGGPERGFFETSSVAGPYFQGQYVGRGLAVADYDNDGGEDVFLNNFGGKGALLHNVGGNKNNWLELRLVGVKSNTSAVGARLRALVAGAVEVQEIGAQPSYISGNSPFAHFGLGKHTKVDSLEVRWPSGLVQLLRNLPINQRLLLVEGKDPVRDSIAPPGASATAAAQATSPPLVAGSKAAPSASAAPAAAAEEEARRRIMVGQTGPLSVGGAATAAERERTRRFWELYRQATSLRLRRQPAAAEPLYVAALQINPIHEDSWYYLGSVRLDQRNFKGAQDAWQKEGETNPHSQKGYARLGDLFSCVLPGAPFDLKRSEQAYRQSLAIYGEQVGAQTSLGIVSLLASRTAEAERRLDEALTTLPGNVIGHYIKGYIAWKRGDRAATLKQFKAAVKGADTAPPQAGATGEGDTKSMNPLIAKNVPCREIPRESEGLKGVDTVNVAVLQRTIEERYRRLDALVRAGQARNGRR